MTEEQMRYELAKAAMQGILSNSDPFFTSRDYNSIISDSINIADKMIKQLNANENQTIK